MSGQNIVYRFKGLVIRLTANETNRNQHSKLSTDQITFTNGGIFAMLEQWNQGSCQEPIAAVNLRIDALVGTFLRSIPGAP